MTWTCLLVCCLGLLEIWLPEDLCWLKFWKPMQLRQELGDHYNVAYIFNYKGIVLTGLGLSHVEKNKEKLYRFILGYFNSQYLETNWYNWEALCWTCPQELEAWLGLVWPDLKLDTTVYFFRQLQFVLDFSPLTWDLTSITWDLTWTYFENTYNLNYINWLNTWLITCFDKTSNFFWNCQHWLRRVCKNLRLYLDLTKSDLCQLTWDSTQDLFWQDLQFILELSLSDLRLVFKNLRLDLDVFSKILEFRHVSADLKMADLFSQDLSFVLHFANTLEDSRLNSDMSPLTCDATCDLLGLDLRLDLERLKDFVWN